jgi:hypothetical protein
MAVLLEGAVQQRITDLNLTHPNILWPQSVSFSFPGVPVGPSTRVGQPSPASGDTALADIRGHYAVNASAAYRIRPTVLW